MKTFISTTASFLLAINILTAQTFELQYEKEFPPEVIEYIIGANQRDFYASADGQTLVYNTENACVVLDEQGNAILKKQYVTKTNKASRFATDFIRNDVRNPMVAASMPDISFEEGSSFYVFEEEGVIVLLDYNLEINEISAYSLASGEELWSTRDFRYTAAKNDQLAKMLLSVAVTKIQQDISFGGAGLATGVAFGSMAQNTLRSGFGAPFAKGIMATLPGTGKFIIKVQDDLVCLDLKTGQEQWRYNQYDFNIGFHQVVNNGNDVVMLHFNPSYLKGNKRLMVNININTGAVNWQTEFINDFKVDRTYVVDDRIILDYFGTEVYDLKSGEQAFLSVEEKNMKRANTMGAMFMNNSDGTRSTRSMVSPSYPDPKTKSLFTSTWKMGGMEMPNDGSSKPIIHKYDLTTGKKVWSSEKLKKGTSLEMLTDHAVICKQDRGGGNFIYFMLDKETGKVIHETDKLDGYAFRNGAGTLFHEGHLYVGVKNGVLVYNTTNWKLAKTIETKSAKIGKLQSMGITGENLMIIGDKGVTFYNPDGEAVGNVSIDDIKGSVWSDQLCYVITPNQVSAIAIEDKSMADTLPFSPMNKDNEMFFSEDGNYVTVIKDNKVASQYSMLAGKSMGLK